MIKRPRILLLIPHLGGGGAEQVTARLLRGLSSDKYEMHLAIATHATSEIDRLPQDVVVHTLNARRVRWAAFRLLRLIHRLKPDLILCGMAHLNFLILLIRPLLPWKTRVLVRQNGTVSAALAIDKHRRFTRLLYRFLYHRADRIVCQTSAMARDLRDEAGLDEKQLVVLANPVDVENLRAEAERQSETGLWPDFRRPRLLAVGRLAHEKGFDLLLRAFVTVRERLPGSQLLIAGEGPEWPALKGLSRELGIESAIQFLGYVERPSAWFREASLYVLPSRHDAMPNALLEAAASGLPIVAMPASEGIVDLLLDRPGVWLAPEITAQALATSLLEALCHLSSGQRFPHSFVEKFRFQTVIDAYEDLIDATLLQSRP